MGLDLDKIESLFIIICYIKGITVHDKKSTIQVTSKRNLFSVYAIRARCLSHQRVRVIRYLSAIVIDSFHLPQSKQHWTRGRESRSVV